MIWAGGGGNTGLWEVELTSYCYEPHKQGDSPVLLG